MFQQESDQIGEQLILQQDLDKLRYDTLVGLSILFFSCFLLGSALYQINLTVNAAQALVTHYGGRHADRAEQFNYQPLKHVASALVSPTFTVYLT